MKKFYKLTRKDYDRLFEGDVKYLVSFYERFEYGKPSIQSTAPKWKKFLWHHYSHIHLFGKLFYYSNSFQCYSIIVNSTCGSNVPVWDTCDLDAFIKEKNLQPGDHLWVGGIYRGDYGRGMFSRGTTKYVILKDGYAIIGGIIGE